MMTRFRYLLRSFARVAHDFFTRFVLIFPSAITPTNVAIGHPRQEALLAESGPAESHPKGFLP